MKKLLLFALLFVSVIANGQETSQSSQDKVFDVVEQMPTFPGGMGALMDFLSKNVKYPEEARKNGIQGTVVVTFVVEKDGSISEPKIARSIDFLIDLEAARVISKMPKWNPGKQMGEIVRVKYALPVTFRLQ